MEVIQVKNLHKKFGSLIALEGVNFTVQKGEIFGYLGPNGAGKTTTIRILLGLLVPTSGSVRVLGYSPGEESFAFRKRIGALLENPGVYEDLSIYDNLQFYANIYRLEDVNKKIKGLLEFMGMEKRMGELAGRLSKGMKQKLAIARLLLHDPEMLFFDEPTAGLDPIFQKEIRDLIQKLSRQGKTIFLSSHNLHEVQEICTRVAFLKEGHLLAVDTVEYFLEQFQNSKKEILFKRRDDKEKACYILRKLGLIKEFSPDLKIEILLNDPGKSSTIEHSLAKQGIMVESITNEPLALEDVFYILMRK